MFWTEFFPTPYDVTYKMLAKFPEKRWRAFLEPSAGKGDIAKRLQEYGATVYCVESDPDLQAVLRSKGLKVVHDDFLSYPPEMKYDGIVMNPPFSNGDEHLLKALSIMENGRVVCLLNSETLANPCTKTRKLLVEKLESLGAELEELGECFKNAERKTGVNVVMVTADVSKPKKENLDWGLSSEIVETSEAFSHTELETGNKAKMIEIQYHRAKELYDLGMQYFSEADRIMESISVPYHSSIRRYPSHEIAFGSGSGTRQSRLADILEDRKAWIWHYVSKAMGLESKLTTKARDAFNERMREQGWYAVTEWNIRKFCESVMANGHGFLEDSILEAFDAFTKYHEENREHVEGWKSNDSWKVNKRIVMPNWLEFWWGNDRPRMAYRAQHADVERALCLLSGKKFEKINGLEHAVRDTDVGQLGDSEFFTFRTFKKGTIHLYWKSEELRDDFNIFVAQKRNWLPPGHTRVRKELWLN